MDNADTTKNDLLTSTSLPPAADENAEQGGGTRSDAPPPGADLTRTAPEQPAQSPAEAAQPPAGGASPTTAAGTAAVAADPRQAPQKPKKAPRARRGPPADGGSEARKTVILTTSKLSGRDGQRLRRGMAVAVPERRLAALERSGKVRSASEAEVAAAERRHGLAEIG